MSVRDSSGSRQRYSTISATIGFPDAPTVAAFVNDRSRHAAIMGPYGCVSGDTEFLTPSGWKRIDEWTPGDRVAQWVQSDGTISFNQPLHYFSYEASELIHFHAGNLSMVLSEEHRMPLYDYRSRFCVKTAGEVALHPSIYHQPVSFRFTHQDAPVSDAEIRMAVAINADANIPKAGHQTIITVRKDRKKSRLRWLLSELELTWAEASRKDCDEEIRFTFTWHDYRQKRFDGWFWMDLSERQLNVVLDEIDHWDGNFASEDSRFFTTSKEDADYIQLAAHSTGGAATIRYTDNENPKWKRSYRVHIARSGSQKAVRNIGRNTKIERVPADRMYCFEMFTGFWVARHNDCVFITGNSSKTTGVLQRMRIHMVEQAPNDQGIRPMRWLATRTTYKELETTTIRDTCGVFNGLGKMHAGSGGRPPRFEYHWRNPDGTESQGEILFLALDRVEDAIESIAGLKLTGAWVNEASNTQKLVVDTIAKRVGRYPLEMEGGVSPTWTGILLDSNAMDEDHWYFKLAEEQKPRGWTFFRQPGAVIEQPGKGRNGKSAWTLNPLAENARNLKPSAEAYYLDGLEGIDDDWIRVKLGNEYGFTVDGKPVHPEYVDSVHCAKGPIPVMDGPIYLGQDYGRTPATIVVQHDPVQDRYYAIDEFWDEAVSAQDYAPEFKRWLDKKFPGKLIAGGWGDPAGDGDGNDATNNTPVSVMRDHGLPIERAPSNQPLLRRGALSGPMRRNCMDGKPALIISPTCKQLRKGLMGGFCYRRMRLAGEYYTEKPDKNEYSHIVEAFEYVLLGMGESTAPRATEFRQEEQQEYAIQ